MNKTQIKKLAIELRAEVDLAPHDRFEPSALANLYGIDVFALSKVACTPKSLRQFSVHRPEVFSGALIPCSDGSVVIVENDFHTPERRISTTSHELAHVMLEHPFATTLTDAKKCRLRDPNQESEADELSGELLIPSKTAIWLALKGASDESVATKFGTSVQFAAWRMNATGARKIAARAGAKRAKRPPT